MPTISPFGIDGNLEEPEELRYSTWTSNHTTVASLPLPHFFSPFDINVKEEARSP
jgi:hypothetical protein